MSKRLLRNIPPLLLLLLFTTNYTYGQSSPPEKVSFDIALMESTYLVRGGNLIGTAFMLFQPRSDQPNTGKMVLVTAAHVFEQMQGDDAEILLREKVNDSWRANWAKFSIRSAGRNLWTRHPTADVAVMYVKPPILPTVHPIGVGILATDDFIRDQEVGPGIQLKALGFPLSQTSNEFGFPILRTGVIASYPIAPSSIVKSFLFDFRVFKGNSGGPAYFSDPEVKGSITMCCKPNFIIGLISEERLLRVQLKDIYETESKEHPLSLGVVVPAPIIKETIDLLPAVADPASDSSTVKMEWVRQ